MHPDPSVVVWECTVEHRDFNTTTYIWVHIFSNNTNLVFLQSAVAFLAL